METDFQHILEQQLEISPAMGVSIGRDGLGNAIQYGSIDMPHSHFRIDSYGTVQTFKYSTPEVCPNDIYSFPTSLTEWNDDIKRLSKGNNAETIMNCIHDTLSYERYATDNTTTAIDAFRMGKGVCQDYAHLMIAACRSAGLMARYVNGLTLGEGETHAWVEVWQSGAWLGYDPTLNCRVETGYLKFAHGRDVNDCPSNRGRFYNWTQERMSVICKLEEL